MPVTPGAGREAWNASSPPPPRPETSKGQGADGGLLPSRTVREYISQLTSLWDFVAAALGSTPVPLVKEPCSRLRGVCVRVRACACVCARAGEASRAGKLGKQLGGRSQSRGLEMGPNWAASLNLWYVGSCPRFLPTCSMNTPFLPCVPQSLSPPCRIPSAMHLLDTNPSSRCLCSGCYKMCLPWRLSLIMRRVLTTKNHSWQPSHHSA